MSAPLTAAMQATVGHVRLRVSRGPRLTGADGAAVNMCDVRLPGAVLGRGQEADLRILDEDEYVSRRHLALERLGLQWFACDLESTHGTVLRVGATALKLCPWIGMPVTNGDELVLAGGRLVLAVEVIRTSPQGTRTRDPTPPSREWRIEDPFTHELINALLEPRRHGGDSAHTPTVAELAETLEIGKRAVYLCLKKLEKIDAIARRLPRDPNTPHYASAVISAYPYLGGRRPAAQ